MSDAEIMDAMLGVMREAFRKPELSFNPNQELREIFGLDSVQFVTLVLTLEEKFRILLPEDQVDRLSTVQSLFDLIKSVLMKSHEAAS